MSTPAVNLTLLLVCAASLSKISKLTTNDVSIAPTIRRSKAVVRSIETLEKDPLKKRMLGECITKLEQAEKAFARGDKKSFEVAKQLVKQSATRCRVVTDFK